MNYFLKFTGNEVELRNFDLDERKFYLGILGTGYEFANPITLEPTCREL